MRLGAAIFIACLAVALSVAAADRRWQPGTWAEPPDEATRVIETAREVFTLDAPASEPLKATPGTAVQFAVDAQTVYVLDDAKAEHALHLRRVAPKYTSAYAALGGGHYIRTVAPDGAFITLEDGSRWDVDPRQRFAVAGWQADDLISIRRSTDDPAFGFEVDDTSQDDGVLANLRAR